jgi:hypothetical protein
MEKAVQSTHLHRKSLRFTRPHFKLLIFSCLILFGNLNLLKAQSYYPSPRIVLENAPYFEGNWYLDTNSSYTYSVPGAVDLRDFYNSPCSNSSSYRGDDVPTNIQFEDLGQTFNGVPQLQFQLLNENNSRAVFNTTNFYPNGRFKTTYNIVPATDCGWTFDGNGGGAVLEAQVKPKTLLPYYSNVPLCATYGTSKVELFTSTEPYDIENYVWEYSNNYGQNYRPIGYNPNDTFYIEVNGDGYVGSNYTLYLKNQNRLKRFAASAWNVRARRINPEPLNGNFPSPLIFKSINFSYDSSPIEYLTYMDGCSQFVSGLSYYLFNPNAGSVRYISVFESDSCVLENGLHRDTLVIDTLDFNERDSLFHYVPSGGRLTIYVQDLSTPCMTIIRDTFKIVGAAAFHVGRNITCYSKCGDYNFALLGCEADRRRVTVKWYYNATNQFITSDKYFSISYCNDNSPHLDALLRLAIRAEIYDSLTNCSFINILRVTNFEFIQERKYILEPNCVFSDSGNAISIDHNSKTGWFGGDIPVWPNPQLNIRGNGRSYDLEGLEDGDYKVFVINYQYNQCDSVPFTVIGSQPSYSGQTFNFNKLFSFYKNLPTARPDAQTWLNPVFESCSLNLNATNFFVLTKQNNFNRLHLANTYFDAQNSVITSRCEMWGGIHSRFSTINLSYSELSNATIGLAIREVEPQSDFVYPNFSNNFDPAFYSNIDIKESNFANNYFHIYQFNGVSEGAKISNSSFSNNGMLKPMQGKAASEACIVGFADGEGNSDLLNQNLKGNIFRDAMYGVLTPGIGKVSEKNNFLHLGIASIRLDFNQQYGGESQVSNQEILINRDSSNNSKYDFIFSDYEVGATPIVFQNAPFRMELGNILQERNGEAIYGILAHTRTLYALNNTITASDTDRAIGSQKQVIGILTRQLGSEGNVITKCDRGIDFWPTNSDVLWIAKNRLINNYKAIYIAAAPGETRTNVFNINCNTFESPGIGTNQPRYGIVIGPDVNISQIGGNGNQDSLGVGYMPSGNVFPVKEGVNRSVDPRDFNFETLTDYWQAPIRYTALYNEGNTSSAPRYWAYNNEYFGERDAASGSVQFQASLANYKCYTSANLSAGQPIQVTDTSWVRICDNSVVDDAVYFPYLIVPALGIDSKIEPKLILAPNPAVSSISLSLRNSNLEIQKLSLFSLAGKELIVPIQNIEGNFELNIEELASGVYFIKVQLSDNTTITKRFIKQ